MVVPFAEKRYYELRPTIGDPRARPPANNGPNGTAIDLDGRFGLNPALQPLKALWDKQKLAIVEATGSPDPTRSHFDAQDYMESGTPGKKRRRMAESRAASGRRGDFAAARDRHGRQVCRARLRGDARCDRGRRLAAVTCGNQDTASILESMYANSADAQLGARRQRCLRRDEDDPVDEPDAVHIRRTARSMRRAASWAAACSRSRA